MPAAAGWKRRKTRRKKRKKTPNLEGEGERRGRGRRGGEDPRELPTGSIPQKPRRSGAGTRGSALQLPAEGRRRGGRSVRRVPLAPLYPRGPATAWGGGTASLARPDGNRTGRGGGREACAGGPAPPPRCRWLTLRRPVPSRRVSPAGAEGGGG